MDSLKEDQVTEPRVAAMFREIQAGQELVNRDQLERVQQRLEDRLSEIQGEVSHLERLSRARDPAPRSASPAPPDMSQVEELMDELERKIMDKVAKDFERKGEASKPKKKMMMMQDDMVGQSQQNEAEDLMAPDDGVEEV